MDERMERNCINPASESGLHVNGSMEWFSSIARLDTQFGLFGQDAS